MSVAKAGLIVLTLFLLATGPAWAHGGAHKKPDETATGEESHSPSPYRVEPEETTGFDDEIPLDRNDLLMDEDSGLDMGHSMDKMGHTMPEVELAHHKLVSPSQKGYPLAAVLTLFSCLVFGFLSIKRLGE